MGPISFTITTPMAPADLKVIIIIIISVIDATAVDYFF